MRAAEGMADKLAGCIQHMRGSSQEPKGGRIDMHDCCSTAGASAIPLETDVRRKGSGGSSAPAYGPSDAFCVVQDGGGLGLREHLQDVDAIRARIGRRSFHAVAVELHRSGGGRHKERCTHFPRLRIASGSIHFEMLDGCANREGPACSNSKLRRLGLRLFFLASPPWPEADGRHGPS